jgi:hypothetical protein
MAVISVTDFKNFRSITGTDATRDARIQVLIDAVQARAERYLDRTFDSGATTTETHDYNSRGVYFLKRTPITSFTKVQFVDVNGNTSDVASGNWKYNSNTGEIHVYIDNQLTGLLWEFGLEEEDFAFNHYNFQAVRFSYTGGYSTMPSDLKLAFLQMTDDLYTANAYGQGVNHQLEGSNLGEMSWTFKSEDEARLLERRYLLPFRQGGVL